MSALSELQQRQYDIAPDHFPASDSLEAQYAFLLRYMILAPSTFNTQPWKFRVTAEGIEVFGDYTRRLPIVDAGNRELLMSIGAAVMNLRVAAAYYGFACSVRYNYSGSSEEPLAFIRLAPRGGEIDPESRQLASLVSSIPKRHTNRNPFLDSRIPAAVVNAVRQCASGSDASVLVSVDGSLNERIADLVSRGDQIQLSDPLYRQNLAEWLRAGSTESNDGVPGEAFGFDDRLALVAQWATRTIDAGKVRAARDRNLCLEAPGLIVICSEEDVSSWLSAGELLEHVLLTLTREGVHHSYFNMPVHLPDLRAEIKQMLSVESWPQLLLRIGYSLTPPVVTPRRPVEDVMIAASPMIGSVFSL